MGLRRGYVVLAGLLGAAIAVVPSVASSETPPIEAVNAGLYSHYWSPAQATVAAGGALAIRNPTATPHGVEWHSGPETPVCSGVPVGTSPTAAASNWSGTCTFSKPGTYVFYCTVHGPEMTETITVGGGETTPATQPTTTAPPTTTPTTPTAPAGEQPPLVSSPSLRFARHGASLRGVLQIAPSGAGGRLEVDVFARGTALGRRAARVRVGRLVRGAVSAGTLSFAVALNGPARRALARRRRLALSVSIVLTPTGGTPQTIKRAVADHA